ncbi:myoneurin-like [Condylostylus longicornis]|uniref:myoneurin-like n=1 Tax=Condylostylus longicornis TaxID=2530218 RepID=UPI00244E5B59|nr:myoneurin-like [Condylostylus longicornis]
MNVEIDTKCCRTCLESTVDNYLVDNPELVKKIEFVTSLRISENDGLPIYFCNSCQKKLEISYQFRLQSIRAFKYLKNHINQIQNQFEKIIKKNPISKKESDNNSCQEEPDNDEIEYEEIKELKIENQEDPLDSVEKPKSSKAKKKKINTTSFKKKQSNKNSSKTNEDFKEINVHKINNDDIFNENNGIEYSKCDICQKMFRKGNLKRHKETHSGDRKFTCQLCNKSFTQKSSLQRHHLTHTGERPFKCDVCDKRFSQSNILKFHMTLHGKEKTYNCSICPYRFIRPENLANHMREKHSSGNGDEVILFVCQFCNKGFKSKHSLKVHKEKLHKDDIVFDMDWSDINDDDSDDAKC